MSHYAAPAPVRRGAFRSFASRGAALKSVLVVFAVCALTRVAAPVLADDLVFGDPSVWRSAPTRTYHVENYRLKLHFDPARYEVFGDEIITLEPLKAGFSRFYLDSADLHTDSVSLLGVHSGSTALASDQQGERLWITLDQEYGPGVRLSVRIVYHGFPRFGLFFENPDANYPDRPQEIWSQGESEFNHHWFPCWDYPNDMATSETITTVPEGQVVVSNGRLKAVTHSRGTVTYDWVEKVPHSSYLTSLAIGPWQKVHDSYKGKAVDYYAVRDVDERTVRRAFHLTPDMIGFYSKLFIPYPYEKYAQVAVKDFLFGGQENVSATTLRESLVLQDAQAAEDFPDTEVVAHELGQHWFGDYVQGGDWADIWLNEGFATYLPALYLQYREGQDAFRLQLNRYQDVALTQDRHDYLRSLVDHHYTDDGMQMLDETTHEKGAVVLDMLRYVLDGPEGASRVGLTNSKFFMSLRRYLTTHAAQSVDTAALEQALRSATGWDLDWFFHEWVYMAGSPAYRVTASYMPSTKSETVTLTQTQQGRNVPAVFDMPVELAFHGANGEEQQVQVRDDQAQKTFTVALGFEPLWIDFDPDDYIEKTVDFSQPLSALSAAAVKDPSMMARLWAVRELGKARGPEVDETASTLTRVLSTDRFYGVRVAAAASLGELRTGASIQGLLGALRQTDSRVRAAVVAALGTQPADAEVFKALISSLRGDPSYAVRAVAASSVGKSGAPQAFDVLSAQRAANPEIHVAMAVESALAATGDARGAELLISDAKPGAPIPLRLSALSGLGSLPASVVRQHSQELTELLSGALHDSRVPVRQSALRLVVVLHLVSLESELAAEGATAPSLWQRKLAQDLLHQFEAAQPTHQ